MINFVSLTFEKQLEFILKQRLIAKNGKDPVTALNNLYIIRCDLNFELSALREILSTKRYTVDPAMLKYREKQIISLINLTEEGGDN